MNWAIVKNGIIELSPRSWSSQVFSKKLKSLGLNTSVSSKEKLSAVVLGDVKILPVNYVVPVLNSKEVLGEISYTINSDCIMATYARRQKTEDELNPKENPETIKRKALENKYLEATKALIQLSGDKVGDEEWPKLEDVDFEKRAALAASNDPATTSLLLATLNYTFFQLKLMNWDWENIEYRKEIV